MAWYSASGVPATQAALASAAIRGEFTSIATSFGYLPTLSGNGNELLRVNSGGTAIETITELTVEGTSVKVNATGIPDLVNEDVPLVVSDGASDHLEMGDRNLQAKSNGTTAATMNLNILGGDIEMGTTTSSVKINGTNAIDLTDEGAALVAGPGGSEHVEIGPYGSVAAVQAKATATTVEILSLNPLGGNVDIGAAAASVKVNGTTDVSLSNEDTALVVGPGAAAHMEIGQYATGSAMVAKANATTVDNMFLQPLGGDIDIGATTTSVQINGTDVPDLLDAGAALTVSNVAGTHLEFGGNDIQAKANGTTATTLEVNPLGGDVDIGATNSATNIVGIDVPDLVSSDAALMVSDVSGVHLEFGGNDIQAKSDATTAMILDLNPAGASVRMHNDGALAAYTRTGGFAVRDDAGTSPQLLFEEDDGTDSAVILSNGAAPLEIRRLTNGQGIELRANNIGGTERLMFDADPDSGVVMSVDGADLFDLNAALAPNLTAADATSVIGDATGSHVEIGINDIQAKSNATTAMDLDINPLGGNVDIATSADTINVNGDIAYPNATAIDISDTAATDSIVVDDGGVTSTLDIQDMGVRVVESSTNQNFVLADCNTLQLLTGVTDRTWTIDTNATTAIHIGAVIYLGSRDTATLTITAAAGVVLTSTLNSADGDSQEVIAGGMAFIVKVATDEWMLAGDVVLP